MYVYVFVFCEFVLSVVSVAPPLTSRTQDRHSLAAPREAAVCGTGQVRRLPHHVPRPQGADQGQAAGPPSLFELCVVWYCVLCVLCVSMSLCM